MAEGADASAVALAAHWAPVFGEGDPVDTAVAQRLLRHTMPSEQVAELCPLTFEEFSSAVAHTRNSSPGPDGLPYSVWDAAGVPGRRILYRAYQALLSRVAPPPEFNRSLVVYIPRDVDPNTRGIPAVLPAAARPSTLSNTSHKLIAKAVNCTLERVAALTVHPAQRGFMPGRGMMENVFEALAPMHVARQLQGSFPAVVFFDIRAAFPSVAWEWISVVLSAIGAPAWLIVVGKVHVSDRRLSHDAGES